MLLLRVCIYLVLQDVCPRRCRPTQHACDRCSSACRLACCTPAAHLQMNKSQHHWFYADNSFEADTCVSIRPSVSGTVMLLQSTGETPTAARPLVPQRPEEGGCWHQVNANTAEGSVDCRHGDRTDGSCSYS